MDERILGMTPRTVIVLLLIIMVIMFVILLVMIHQMNVISRKYTAFMQGRDGEALEKMIHTRLKEIDQLKQVSRKLINEQRSMQTILSGCVSKYALVKYDAFEEMAGKLSYAVALLDNNGNGIVLNSIHSREGCFTYAKEIVRGESYIPLSEEEKQALSRAKTAEEEIKEMIRGTDKDSKKSSNSLDRAYKLLD